MFRQTNEEGKLLNNVVAKISLNVVIQTVSHQIIGKIEVRPEERLKDEMNRAEQYLVVIDAIVINSRNQPLFKSKSLSVNRDHIVWISTKEDIAPFASKKKETGS